VAGKCASLFAALRDHPNSNTPLRSKDTGEEAKQEPPLVPEIRTITTGRAKSHTLGDTTTKPITALDFLTKPITAMDTRTAAYSDDREAASPTPMPEADAAALEMMQDYKDQKENQQPWDENQQPWDFEIGPKDAGGFVERERDTALTTLVQASKESWGLMTGGYEAWRRTATDCLMDEAGPDPPTSSG